MPDQHWQNLKEIFHGAGAAAEAITCNLALLRKTYPSQEVGIAWIGAHIIEAYFFLET